MKEKSLPTRELIKHTILYLFIIICTWPIVNTESVSIFVWIPYSLAAAGLTTLIIFSWTQYLKAYIQHEINQLKDSNEKS